MFETMFKCKALRKDTDPTKNHNWVEGYYVKHLTVTPSPIWPNKEEDRKRLEEEYDAMTKHYVFRDGFSDWNMENELEKIEVDGRTLQFCAGVLVPIKGYKYKHPLFQGDVVEIDATKELGVVVWCKDIAAFIIIRKEHVKYNDGYPQLNLSNPQDMLRIVSDVAPVTYVGSVFDKLRGRTND